MRCRIISFFIIIGFIGWITDFVIKVFNGNITTRYVVSTLIVSIITVLHIVEDRLHVRGKIKSNLLYFLIAACYPVFIFVYFHLLWLNLFFKVCLEDSNALGAFVFVAGSMRRQTRPRQDSFNLVAIQSQPYWVLIAARLRGNIAEIGAQYGWDYATCRSVGWPMAGKALKKMKYVHILSMWWSIF